MSAWVRRQGDAVHHTRVARLMPTRGREARSPTPRTSPAHPTPRVYPYGLRGVPITRANHVWSTAITSSRLPGGCISLGAVRAWCRRYVRSWAVAITMEVGFCLEALEQALQVAHPEIGKSDQGAQFPRIDFTGR